MTLPVVVGAGRSGLALRVIQLLLGLIAYGVSMVLMVQASLGVMPWDVLHQGLAVHSGWPMGRVSILVGALVLLAWWPIRQRPGFGTVANVLVIGVVFDLVTPLLVDIIAPLSLPLRGVVLVSGVILNGLATAAYLGARFGPGPRDGLMTGISRRSGWPLRRVRTLIEGSVLGAGFLLGGGLGLGTLLYALAIGPLIQAMLPLFDRQLREQRRLAAGTTYVP